MAIIAVLTVLVCILPIYATHSSSSQTHSDQQLGQEKIQKLKNSTYQQIQDLQQKILQIIEEIRLLRKENAHLSQVQLLQTEISNLESQMRSLTQL